jgi:hypothetical protein
MFQKKVVMENKRFKVNRNFFFKNPAFYEKMWKKYCETDWPPDGNMAHAHCILDIQVYKHTLRICNTHCISTAAVVA